MDETDISIFNFGRKKRDKHDGSPDNDSADDVADDIDSALKGPVVSIPTDADHYDTSHRNIGVALIFNHKDIRGQKSRSGTEKDKKRVQKVLKSYGFAVRDFDDLSFAEITDTLKEVAREDHSQNDCFMVVVMSHGLEGKVFASDMAYPVERLWTPFLGENCRSLISKPKLFFLQACRGEKLEKPVQYRSKEAFKVMSRLDAVAPEPPKPVTFAIPNTADLLVMYSTYEGSYSWRNPLNGSWFIQSMCEVLEKFAGDGRDVELYYFLTAINRKVAYEFQSNVPNNEIFNEMKEMPNFVSTLTKTFFLRIKPN